MDTIHIDVAGVRQVGLRFDEFPDALYADLRQEIEALTNELFARVTAATPVLLGTLRSQERVRLFTDETRITGYIDIAGGDGSKDYAKAGALEYGTTGKANAVASHSMRLDHFWELKLASPITVVTQAFSRTPNIAQHAFERGPLEEMRPAILARLNAVTEKTIAKVNA